MEATLSGSTGSTRLLSNIAQPRTHGGSGPAPGLEEGTTVPGECMGPEPTGPTVPGECMGPENTVERRVGPGVPELEP